MEFGRERKFNANNEKRRTTNDGKNRTAKSRKIRTLGKNETYKHLGILVAGTIKQNVMKEKKKKMITSGGPENYSKQNDKAEISSKR